MMIELVVKHNGRDWIVGNEEWTLSAPTLEELDEKVETLVKEKGLVKKGETKKIFMAFDNSIIPQWIRQYAQHYFNRIIEIKA